MQINLIWAQAKNRVIGLNGKMPWHLPEDLSHFKQTTMGFPVIMGRKTWDGLPAKFKPLGGRLNFVISSQVGIRAALMSAKVVPVKDLQAAFAICAGAGYPEVWVIGGGQIYAQALRFAHKLVITELEQEFEGDSFAPELDPSWNRVNRDQHESNTGIKYSISTWKPIDKD